VARFLERRGSRYIGIGGCIYCGCVPMPPDRLTEEHIVPLALSGRGENGESSILDASCVDCAKIINRHEARCLRGFMLPSRLLYNTKSRRRARRDSRPDTINFVTIGADGARLKKISVPISQSPLFGVFPQFIPARILLRVPPLVHGQYARMIHHFSEDPNGRAKTLADGALLYEADIDGRAFSKMMAKIAYCYAYAELGPRRFTPIVLDYILDKMDPGPDFYVGETIFPVFETLQKDKIGIELAIFCTSGLPIRNNLLVVQIILFRAGTSVVRLGYDCVVGIMSPQQSKEVFG
jgi:hypothetical protein